MMSDEIGPLITIIDKWVERAFYGKKSKDEQRDKNLLKSAGSLVAALRGLDNYYRKLLGKLRLFDSDWPVDKRSRL